MNFLAAAWEQVYGLLVEDGQIAIGTLAAFVACGAVSALAGLFCAFHPFWVVNVAELNDGVLTSFLLSAFATIYATRRFLPSSSSRTVTTFCRTAGCSFSTVSISPSSMRKPRIFT